MTPGCGSGRRRRNGLATILCIEDRPAEVARQRRTQARNARVVARQVPAAPSAVVRFSRGVELFRRRIATPCLQRVDQRRGDAEADRTAETISTLRESRVTRGRSARSRSRA